MSLFIFAITTSIAGVTWIKFLVTPGDLLDFVPHAIDRFFPYKKYKKLHKVLCQCEKCFAGQLALWLYPIYFFEEYTITHHILAVIFSIFSAAQISSITNKIEQ